MNISEHYQEVVDLLTNNDRMKKELGFKLDETKDKNNPEDSAYLKYINTGKIHYNIHYGAFPEPQGKVIIYLRLDYDKSKDTSAIFAEIRQDGDTRKVYHGIIPSIEFLKQLLYSIR